MTSEAMEGQRFGFATFYTANPDPMGHMNYIFKDSKREI